MALIEIFFFIIVVLEEGIRLDYCMSLENEN